MNTQPWNFTVLTGEPLDRIRAGNTERNLAGLHSREFRIGQPFANQHRDRQWALPNNCLPPWALLERTKKVGKIGFCADSANLMRQFVIITYDRVLADGDDTAFDCGAVTTALVNAAWSRVSVP